MTIINAKNLEGVELVNGKMASIALKEAVDKKLNVVGYCIYEDKDKKVIIIKDEKNFYGSNSTSVISGFELASDYINDTIEEKGKISVEIKSGKGRMGTYLYPVF